MTQRARSALGDLLSALIYVVALGMILAALILPYRVLLGATPPRETSGAAAQADSSREPKFVTWRLTPEEAQRRFEAPSLSLLPPTPAPPIPENWSPSYAATAKKQALEKMRSEPAARSRARAPGPKKTDPQTPTNAKGGTRVAIDHQMGGR
jgi:hypothetical protein